MNKAKVKWAHRSVCAMEWGEKSIYIYIGRYATVQLHKLDTAATVVRRSQSEIIT